MKNKQNILLISVIAMAMFCTILASAAVTVVAPTTGAYLSGTFLVNCSYENITDIVTPTIANTSFYWNGSGTNVVFATRTGMTVTDNAVYATLRTDDTGIVNGIGTIKCSLGNATMNRLANATVTLVTIDDTDPGLSVTPATISYGRTIDYSCTDATAGISTFAVVNPKGESTALNQGSQTHQFTSTSDDGTYTFTCTDAAGNAVSSTVTVEALMGNANQQNTGNAGTQQSGGLNIWIILAIIAIIYLATKKK